MAGLAHGQDSQVEAPLSARPGEAEPAGPNFPEATRARVLVWLREIAPESPADRAGEIVDAFLVQVQRRDPAALARMEHSSAGLPEWEGGLWRAMAQRLTAAEGAQRETAALRRVVARFRSAPGVGEPEAKALLAQLRDQADFRYRRLLDGRMDDEELERVWRRFREPPAAAASAPVARPARELTATEIVSEFGRRNQEGAAAGRLEAYALAGTLTTGGGEKQDLLLFRMRPNRFRLAMRKDGVTTFILAADGERFWQQIPGRPPMLARAADVGNRRHLREFLTPLLAPEGYRFERTGEREEDGRRMHRLSVSRPDGSSYITWIDQESFREVGRELPDGSVARYSDFRDVAGISIAHREEIVAPDGRRTVLEINRISPNPGLFAAFFEPPRLTGSEANRWETAWAGR